MMAQEDSVRPSVRHPANTPATLYASAAPTWAAVTAPKSYQYSPQLSIVRCIQCDSAGSAADMCAPVH